MRPKVIMPINCAIGVLVRTTVREKVPSTNENKVDTDAK
jgi:hypothetical protein